MNKKRFRTDNKSKNISKSQLKKLNPELYKRLYGPDSPTGRMKKRQQEQRKRFNK